MLFSQTLSKIYNLKSNILIYFFLSFLQSNGYKPTPLDLSGIQLNEKMVELVDLLAENTHNVWAKDRIKHGWTYGLYEVCKTSLICSHSGVCLESSDLWRVLM